MTLAVRSVTDLLPGDIGFATIQRAGGALILGAQAMIDVAAVIRGRAAESAGPFTHAFVVAGDTVVVEAMPGGAIKTTGDNRFGPGYAYARISLTDSMRQRVADAARAQVGVPYGYASYAAIAGLTLLGGSTASPRGLLARYVNRRGPGDRLRREICSELVDESYRLAGIHLFADGRPPAYATPGALFWRVAQLGEVYIC